MLPTRLTEFLAGIGARTIPRPAGSIRGLPEGEYDHSKLQPSGQLYVQAQHQLVGPFTVTGVVDSAAGVLVHMALPDGTPVVTRLTSLRAMGAFRYAGDIVPAMERMPNRRAVDLPIGERAVLFEDGRAALGRQDDFYLVVPSTLYSARPLDFGPVRILDVVSSSGRDYDGGADSTYYLLTPRDGTIYTASEDTMAGLRMFTKPQLDAMLAANAAEWMAAQRRDAFMARHGGAGSPPPTSSGGRAATRRRAAALLLTSRGRGW